MKYLQYNISVTIFKINIDTPVVAFMYWTCTKSYQHNLSNKKNMVIINNLIKYYPEITSAGF